MKTIKLNQTKGTKIYIPINKISYFYQADTLHEGPNGKMMSGIFTLVQLTGKNDTYFVVHETPEEISLLLSELK